MCRAGGTPTRSTARCSTAPIVTGGCSSPVRRSTAGSRCGAASRTSGPPWPTHRCVWTPSSSWAIGSRRSRRDDGGGSVTRVRLATAAVVLIAAVLLLAYEIPPVPTWFYVLAWYPTLVILDEAVVLLGGESLLARPRDLERHARDFLHFFAEESGGTVRDFSAAAWTAVR